MALPVHRAVFWDEFPTVFFAISGAEARSILRKGARCCRTEQNAPSFPPPRAAKEGRREEGRKFVPDGHTGSIHSDFALF